MDLIIREYEVEDYGLRGKELKIIYKADHWVFHSTNLFDKLDLNLRSEFNKEVDALSPKIKFHNPEYLQNIFLWTNSPVLHSFSLLPVYQSLLNKASLFGLQKLRAFLTDRGYIATFDAVYQAMADVVLIKPLVVSLDPSVVGQDELNVHLRIKWPNGIELEANLDNREACDKLFEAVNFFPRKDVLLIIGDFKHIVSTEDLSKFIFN